MECAASPAADTHVTNQNVGADPGSHDAGFYAGDAEFRALIVPFVDAATRAGDPVIIGYDERKNDLLRAWAADPAAITFLDDSTLYATPADAIDNYRRLFARLVAGGATRIRIAGDVPHAGNGGRFAGWDRYESAVNTVWDMFPVHSLCLYDAATISEQVRDVVLRTHPVLVSANEQRQPNSRYEHPHVFVPLAPVPDPLEAVAPLLTLTDPTPARARKATHHLAAEYLLDQPDDLVFGVSEAVTNAWVHGTRPITMGVRAAANRMLVHVHDCGPGPADQLVGLVRSVGDTTGGFGLWLIHKLPLEVALLYSLEGFTVRLATGTGRTDRTSPLRTWRANSTRTPCRGCW